MFSFFTPTNPLISITEIEAKYLEKTIQTKNIRNLQNICESLHTFHVGKQYADTVWILGEEDFICMKEILNQHLSRLQQQ